MEHKLTWWSIHVTTDWLKLLALCNRGSNVRPLQFQKIHKSKFNRLKIFLLYFYNVKDVNSICERKSSTEVRLIHTGQMSSKNFIILWKNNRYTNNRPFQERRAIACGHAHTHAEAFRSVSNCMCKSNFWLHLFYYKIVCLWSTYMPILMLSLNKGLSLIIKLKFW